MELSRKLNYLSKIRKIRPEVLSEHAGISSETISEWMNGSKEPNLAEYRALSKALGLSLDYLSGDEPITEEDGETAVAIQKQMDLEKLEDQVTAFREVCRDYLEQFEVDYDDCILPSMKEGSVDYGCFVEGMSSPALSLGKLLAKKQSALIAKVFPNNVSLKEAIQLDHVGLVELALKNYQPPKENPRNVFFDDSRRFPREIDDLLENLDRDLNHYFEFVVLLIDFGAQYTKQIGYGYDVTCFQEVTDTSKTAFFYNVARAMIDLKKKNG